ncbi:hypothetical protein HYC85_011986 [Camellia sinensis]|uniref:Disease resistance protein At4g27190-like leucine-rich repeats domain-containing protein n=1 Tax=Camellia sinensis TaxID=4442 RepID=A0A7J7HAM4_CAMSI|nr:hypothetical protein HYC85_011986 [Camellia sinensis]
MTSQNQCYCLVSEFEVVDDPFSEVVPDLGAQPVGILPPPGLNLVEGAHSPPSCSPTSVAWSGINLWCKVVSDCRRIFLHARHGCAGVIPTDGANCGDVVSFPKLKTLVLDNCVNSRGIHPWNLLASKISLKFLDVANLDKLIVRNCSEVAEVFQLEGLNVREGQHVRPLIEVRMMELDGLPQLTCLWNKDPHGILGLQGLQYLTIKKCSLLRNLFTCSTAMALQQLKVLYLESCPVMEEVIAAIEDGLKEVIDVIEFPKLEWLILKDLPNLNSFCNSNYNFNLPSLNRVVLKRCPDMHNFTLGQVRMSQIFVSTRGNEGLWTEDLNKYLEERLLKGEECATVNESDFDIEEEEFSNLYWLDE